MMTRERELLQQALDALLTGYHQGTQDAIAALREALAAPEPEPVAEVYRARYGRRARNVGVDDVRKLNGVALPPLGTKLYAAPPAAPAPAAPVVPLTDEQLAKIAVEDEFLLYCDQDSFNEIARAIEAAHGITGASK